MNIYLKYSGIFGVAVLWFVVPFGMVRSGLGLFDERPLSYIGVATESATLFNSGLIISALLFFFFGVYLYRRLHLSKLFLATITFGQIAQIIAALYTYGGADKQIHTTAAFALAVAIPFYMKFFVQSLPSSNFARKAREFFQAEKLFFVIGIGAFIFLEGIAPFAEILPALPFHAWILYTTRELTSKKS